MPDNNMRIWEAVSKTDPAHTKKVTFGRTFTSIDAHWQVMQATNLFGPVGEGWGYDVAHSVITLTPEIILAVADVTIWWHIEPAPRRSYGPIRATCEMYGHKTDRGKIIPGLFVTDEDAPKKAMTDALTKGLSHLGFSADVFLGLFDDNRYVQKVAKEFANGGASTSTGTASDGSEFRPERRSPGNAQTESLRVDPADRDMVQGDGRSQYETDKAKKVAASTGPLGGREATAAEARKAKIAAAVNKRVEFLKKTSAWTRDGLNQFWTDNEEWIDWMTDPNNKAMTEYDRFSKAYADAELTIRPVELA